MMSLILITAIKSAMDVLDIIGKVSAFSMHETQVLKEVVIRMKRDFYRPDKIILYHQVRRKGDELSAPRLNHFLRILESDRDIILGAEAKLSDHSIQVLRLLESMERLNSDTIEACESISTSDHMDQKMMEEALHETIDRYRYVMASLLLQLMERFESARFTTYKTWVYTLSKQYKLR